MLTRALPAVVLLAAVACTPEPGTASPAPPVLPALEAPPGRAQRFTAVVVGEHPHDPTAFTQGLEAVPGDPDRLLESTGGHGTSSLRLTDLATGQTLRHVDIPGLYTMGATTVPGVGVWQLTWKDHTALLRDPDTLAETARVPYAGEGWGICFDGTRLITSDGTDRLVFRDPRTFARTGEVRVTLDGRPLSRLNELDCQHGTLWANVWLKHHAVTIDPRTGRVLTVVDLSRVVALENTAHGPEAVLNGLATLPDTDDLLVAGKLYATTYRVRPELVANNGYRG